ncbi:MAG TPA: hypothetical protein VN851_11450 [Thermoanaerobaculia bacterium]|nr:hypothetical protein [Thermoanaerobaculia bacterium]
MTEPKIPPRPTGPHPTAEQLYLAVAAERSGARCPADEEVFAHAASCADCSAEIANLEAFEQPEPVAPMALDAAWQRFRRRAGTADDDGSRTGRVQAAPPPRQATIVPFPAPSSRPAAALSPWRYAGWAAAAMLVLGLGLGFFLGTSTVQTITPIPVAPAVQVASHAPAPPGRPEPASPEGSPGPGVSGMPDALRGGTLSDPGEVTPTGRLDQAPTELRFANPNHEPKRVLLFATDPPYQWQSPETTAERIELPAAERAKLKPGVDYFWSVLDAEGESAAQTFQLRRR